MAEQRFTNAQMWEALIVEMTSNPKGIICKQHQGRNSIPQMIIGVPPLAKLPTFKVGITTFRPVSDHTGDVYKVSRFKHTDVTAITPYTALTRHIRINILPFFWKEEIGDYISADEFWSDLFAKHNLVDLPVETIDNTPIN